MKLFESGVECEYTKETFQKNFKNYLALFKGHQSMTQKKLEEMFDRETVNKIKIDSNKIEAAINEAHGASGNDGSLITSIEQGLIVVAGQKPSGELIYNVPKQVRDK